MNIFLLPLATLLGWSGALIVARHGRRVGLIDYPTSRSSHTFATPRGGGIGILAAVAAASVILGLPWYSWMPAVSVASCSIWADRTEIAPSARLKIHFSAALSFLIATSAATHGQWSIWLLTIPLAIFIVGTANVYNFMDGINGIAGISGIVGFGLLAVFSAEFQTRDDLIIWYCVSAAACAGFLPLNFPRARVFMGDVGSILLGFLIACGMVTVSRSPTEFICTASFLFPFYADELTTMFVRLRDGENLTTAHRRHMYQLLVNELKCPHWKVALLYGAIQAFVGTVSLLLVSSGWRILSLFLLACFAGFLIIQAYVRRMASRNCHADQASMSSLPVS